MGRDFGCPVFLGFVKGVGQKKERFGLHGHVKKPSNIETNIGLENCETYCCIRKYIFGFGIPWSGLSVKSFLALVPVQNGGCRSCSKNRACHNVYFLNRLG